MEVNGSYETSVYIHQAKGCHMQIKVKIQELCISVTG